MAQITIVIDTKTETLENVLADMNWGQRSSEPESLNDDSQTDFESQANVPDDIKEFAQTKKPEEDAVELDSDGIPWDERIHSSNHKKTQKGVWQRQRGIDPSYYDEIYSELKTGVAVAPLPAPDVPPLPAPDAPPPPPAPVVDGSWNWNTLVKSLAQAIKSGEVTKADQDSALKAVGVELFPLLSVRTDLYDAFAAKLGLKQ